MRIGIVAGEASGDILGAGLVTALKRRLPDAEFRGIAGPLMEAAGVQPLFHAEELSVMGLFEVLGRLPRLLRVRRELIDAMCAWQADVFIGIDAPDFNLPVEKRLRKTGMRTVHYVSPTVWAWRPGRVKVVEQAADAVLCLFPFEPDHYAQSKVTATHVGHPLASRLYATEAARTEARGRFGLSDHATVLAVLPGSRGSELRHLGAAMAGAIQRLAGRDLHFIAPMVNPTLAARFKEVCERYAPGVQVTMTDGDSRAAMIAADVVLTASGTATLEAMLLGRPMVVAYRLAPLTVWFLRFFKLLRIERFALPNLLAGRDLVPELIQQQATPDAIAAEVARLLDEPEARQAQTQAFEVLRERLRAEGDETAADAVMAALS